MTELLTAAQMRAIEQAAIESGEVTGLELMERAGRGVVDAILEWRPELATAPHRAVVLCGPGNNGGDGFVVARLLKQRGWEVEVYLYGDEVRLPPDAAENARHWREIGEIQRLSADSLPTEFDICIDAILGIGLSRSLSDELYEIVDCVDTEYEAYFPNTVSIDVPTGVCSDSGRRRDCSFVAALTITFHRAKVGHVVDHLACGELRIIDIGLEKFDCWSKLNAPPLGVIKTGLPLQFFTFSKKLSQDYKYSHGHALILSGGSGKGGAARLAARGALRVGAGLVTVCCPQEALVENAARLDAIMLAAINGVEGLQTELVDRKVKAVCIGPGFGLGERLRDFIAAVLAEPSERSRVKPGTAGETRLAVVLDADALTEYRKDPETLFAMLHDRCVVTPHEGEFGRLFPDILARLKEPATKGPAYSKVDATRDAAKRAGCVVLFKGADTVIAHPDGRCTINSAHYERSAPWLATAGSGDVLAGFITGLLARGFEPMQAAETAAWLHVECALKFGPGLIAEDLPEQLPAVFRDLGL